MTILYIVLAVALALLLLPAIAGATLGTATATEKKESAYFGDFIRQYAAQFGVPAKRVAAIIIHESDLDSNAVGKAGERGLMQLEPGAVADINATYGLNISFDDLFDPETNIKAGCAYLAIQYSRTSSWDKATQAYNAGAKAVSVNPSAALDYLSAVKGIESTLITF